MDRPIESEDCWCNKSDKGEMMNHYATIELDFDPICVVCDVEYQISKSFQPHEFGERVLVDIEDIRLDSVYSIRLDFLGREEELDITDERVEQIRTQVSLEEHQIVEQIVNQMEKELV